MENTKKDSPEVEKDNSKTKVLDLQELDQASGGAAADQEAWSTMSRDCKAVEVNEWSTVSEGC